MEVMIDRQVQERLPELSVYYSQLASPGVDFTAEPSAGILALRLAADEVTAYMTFRERIAGDRLLAVERLNGLGLHELPNPHPLTHFIIKCTYHTRIPITVFSPDMLSGPITLRFSEPGEQIDLAAGIETLPEKTLVAATVDHVIGMFATKSAVHGALADRNEHIVILSFGVNEATGWKSERLVRLAATAVASSTGLDVPVVQRAVRQ